MSIYLTLCTDVPIPIAKDGSIISVLAPSKLRIRPPGIYNVLILTLAINGGAPVNICVDLVNQLGDENCCHYIPYRSFSGV